MGDSVTLSQGIAVASTVMMLLVAMVSWFARERIARMDAAIAEHVKAIRALELEQAAAKGRLDAITATMVTKDILRAEIAQLTTRGDYSALMGRIEEQIAALSDEVKMLRDHVMPGRFRRHASSVTIPTPGGKGISTEDGE